MEMAVNCKLILYADDSVIMVSDKDPKVFETKSAIELNSINNFLILNKSSFHYGKCESMLFASKYKCKRISDFNDVINCSTVNSNSNISQVFLPLINNVLNQIIIIFEIVVLLTRCHKKNNCCFLPSINNIGSYWK